MTRLRIRLLLVAALAAGCRSPSARIHDDHASDAGRLERLDRISGALLPEGGVNVGLSPRDGLGAWAWPDGSIRVSRALADQLDDDELAAALGHEIGHLLDGGHLPAVPHALQGESGAGNLELRADRIGCALLAHRGFPGDSMRRMLATVAAGFAGNAAELAARLAALDAACAPAAAAR